MQGRIIKFRAYDELTKIWSYFDLDSIEQDESYRTYLNGMKKSDKTIIEQYTGLKDKNGKEIYENIILNNRYLVIKIFTKYILYDILNKDILDGGINADTIEITGEYQKLSENQKRDINKYLQQAKRKIKTKGLAFA